MSLLEALPTDLTSEIMLRVGAHSREDLTNCMLTCKGLCGSVNDPKVFRNLDISPLPNSPILSVSRYSKLMEKCMFHSNPTAQYVKGILEYFVEDNANEGLRYLKEAANASVQEAVYLYGILMLVNGMFEEGRHYMEKLNWRVNRAHAENCWANIRRSFRDIFVILKPIYIESLEAVRGPWQCNHSSCEHCYYHQKMFEFVFNL